MDFPDTFNAGATLGPVNETNMARIWNKHKQLNTTLKPKVFVATYTNEGLKFQMIIGPLKFERSKRGGDYTSRKIPVATIETKTARKAVLCYPSLPFVALVA